MCIGLWFAPQDLSNEENTNRCTFEQKALHGHLIVYFGRSFKLT